jgi:hypothetical protein
MLKMGLHVVSYLGCFMFVVLMSACSSNVISIDSKDSTKFTTLETSIPLSKQRIDRIKLRATRVSGDYSQSVPSGKLVVIEDNQIQGPADVSGTTDLTYVSIGYGADDIFTSDDWLDGRLRARGYLGLAQTDMDLTLVHEGTTYRTSDKTIELYMQVGVSYAITPALHGGGTWATTLGSYFSGINEIDLRLDYALLKHLKIMAGYRWFEYNYLVDEDDSTIRVKFRGPFVGLYIPF